MSHQDEGPHRVLPDELRERAVEHLRAHISAETAEQIRDLQAADPELWWAVHHFGMGMTVRNLLREVIEDDELPPVPYDDERSYQNWDDYYIPVLEEAADCGRLP